MQVPTHGRHLRDIAVVPAAGRLPTMPGFHEEPASGRHYTMPEFHEEPASGRHYRVAAPRSHPCVAAP